MVDPDTPTGLPFVKMHGAGNDFVIIDSRGRGPVVTAALALALGDRHRGVGFDQLAELHGGGAGVLLLDFWNNDGSRAGACGNATRCVADRVMAQDGHDRLTLVTTRGALHAVRQADGRVSVNMGLPQRHWDEIPLARDVDPLHLPLDGDPAAVGMGNPHAVFFVPDVAAVDLMGRGAEVERDPMFPQHTNVEFVQVLAPDHLRVRVWERGAGVTLACGSGACAVAVAAHLRGLTGRQVRLDMDGGTLWVDWCEDGVWLTGPAAHVFDGWLSPEFLATHL